ncbi:uncharacterized protein SOCE836_081130 [Sorangium cellulosum]|uniref:Uncharacterized protein n=1 Tax=Sorangium cellulosum TaxID=56 RepID=A0A4P2R094_SORCE|nr:uncharacterized protein SOCE836_081130 [Sorangium cellulosum]WCQ95211.1 hypothetical protein NQZ70_07987 [Sorangium sp. Soce836]
MKRVRIEESFPGIGRGGPQSAGRCDTEAQRTQIREPQGRRASMARLLSQQDQRRAGCRPTRREAWPACHRTAAIHCNGSANAPLAQRPARCAQYRAEGPRGDRFREETSRCGVSMSRDMSRDIETLARTKRSITMGATSDTRSGFIVRISHGDTHRCSLRSAPTCARRRARRFQRSLLLAALPRSSHAAFHAATDVSSAPESSALGSFAPARSAPGATLAACRARCPPDPESAGRAVRTTRAGALCIALPGTKPGRFGRAPAGRRVIAAPRCAAKLLIYRRFSRRAG